MADPEAELHRLSEQFAAAFDREPVLDNLTDAARRVLAVAAALFYQQGSAATSVRELARACRLSPGAIYNHFGSREDLLFTLVETGHVRAKRELITALAEPAADPQVQFVQFVRAYTELHLRLPAYAQLVHREYVHLSDDHKREIINRRRLIRDQLVAILRAGSAAGRFHLVGGPHAEIGTAMMVLDMCSRTSEWFNPNQPSERFSDRYAEAALRLVGAVPASPSHPHNQRPPT